MFRRVFGRGFRRRVREPHSVPALMLAGALFATLAAAPPAHPARHKPPHVGVVHPYPRFCRDQEHSQRDLRLLRLAFRITPHPLGAEALPWFYKVYRAGNSGQGKVWLALDTRALWNMPLSTLAGHDPQQLENIPGHTRGDRLRAWRAVALARIPGLEQSSLRSLAQFEVPARPDLHFWQSRLGGSAVLPFYSDDSASAESSCVQWPRGIVYTPGQGGKGYTLLFTQPYTQQRSLLPGQQGAASGGFRISAYPNLKPMLRDLQSGRLNAALLDGGELAAALEAGLGLPQATAGRSPGTQQLVLKPRLGLGETLERDAMGILSRAIPRGRLARAAGPGFTATQAFISPKAGEPDPEQGDVLAWDARTARGDWLKLDNPRRKLTLAVLTNPQLQRVAQALASQLKKTLGLEITILALSVERFHLPGGAAKADFTLMVADLDDGSLQDLWRTALELHPAVPGGDSLAGMEALMRKNLPYLPLIQANTFLLAVSPTAYERSAHLCPGCMAAPLESYRDRL